MSNQVIARSPFSQIDFNQLAASSEVLAINEQAFLGYINLRGSTVNQAFMSACESVLGVRLPTENNTFESSSSGVDILWYGPDEWLLITPHRAAPALSRKLAEALQGVFSAVNEVTGGNTLLELSGSAARELLSKGCPMDLHSSVFSTGQCAQTLIGKTGFTLYQTDQAPNYKLVVRRSFADYLGHWLLDAAKEFS
jgi:sarcosine oxidase subunit gamma